MRHPVFVRGRFHPLSEKSNDDDDNEVLLAPLLLLRMKEDRAEISAQPVMHFFPVVHPQWRRPQRRRRRHRRRRRRRRRHLQQEALLLLLLRPPPPTLHTSAQSSRMQFFKHHHLLLLLLPPLPNDAWHRMRGELQSHNSSSSNSSSSGGSGSKRRRQHSPSPPPFYSGLNFWPACLLASLSLVPPCFPHSLARGLSSIPRRTQRRACFGHQGTDSLDGLAKGSDQRGWQRRYYVWRNPGRDLSKQKRTRSSSL